MNDSDRRYLARFALDPTMEYRWEDLYAFDFPCPYDDEMDPFDDENILDAKDTIPENDFLFKK